MVRKLKRKTALANMWSEIRRL